MEQWDWDNRQDFKDYMDTFEHIFGYIPEEFFSTKSLIKNEDDACYDVASIEDVILEPLVPTKVKTGIHTQMPKGYHAILKDRSGLASKGVHVLGGVIDNSYRGEWQVVLVSFTNRIEIKAGDRIAQALIMQVPHIEWKQVNIEELNTTERGSKGFGSSGK